MAGQTRREFLWRAGAAITVAAACSLGATAESGDGVADDGILRLRLRTGKLAELRAYYTQTLGLTLAKDSEDSITVKAGRTLITFDAEPGSRAYYHFAFNIPENKLAASKRWLHPRSALVRRPDGSDEYHFASWNADSVYFLDPAGNILEFIARHNLKNAAEGEFSTADILYASEIALVVDDVVATADAAKARLGMDRFGGGGSDQFAAVGDDHRLLIIVKQGRRWLGAEDRAAEVFQTNAVLRGERAAELPLSPRPYGVTLEAP
jgi:catechol-2,3-dioxygenase